VSSQLTLDFATVQKPCHSPTGEYKGESHELFFYRSIVNACDSVEPYNPFQAAEYSFNKLTIFQRKG
jgi:hypothetical protein